MATVDFDSLLAQARRDGRSSLSEPEAKQALAAMGIAVPAGEVAADAASAAAIAARLPGPFAVKVVSPDILHKSDARAVSIRLADADAVRVAVETMSAGGSFVFGLGLGGINPKNLAFALTAATADDAALEAFRAELFDWLADRAETHPAAARLWLKQARLLGDAETLNMDKAQVAAKLVAGLYEAAQAV
jgi:hypothetical protein